MTVPQLAECRRYGRNSTDHQRDLVTILSQIEALDTFGTKNSYYDPCEPYVDEGWSGFVAQRPAIDKLMSDAAEPGRTWHHLLIYDSSRLTREPGHRMGYFEPYFRALKVQIIYVASPLFDDTPMGEAMGGMSAIFDKLQARLAKETLTRGLLSKVRNGSVWWCPYGYEVIKISSPTKGFLYTPIPHPEHAQVVQDIFARVIGGQSANSVAREFNLIGIKSARGGKWSGKTIAEVIHDPFYIGEAGHGRYERVQPKERRLSDTEKLATKVYRKKPKTTARLRPQEEWTSAVPTSVPALVSRDAQERAEAMLASSRRRSARPTTDRVYLLRGLLRCKYTRLDLIEESCNYGLAARTRTTAKGTELPYYRCNRSYDASTLLPGSVCSCCNTLPAPYWEERIWEWVMDLLTRTDDLHAEFEKMRHAPHSERTRWEQALVLVNKELEEEQACLRAAQRAYETGVYGQQEYVLARDELLPKLADLKDRCVSIVAQLNSLRSCTVQWAELENLCQELVRQGQQADRATKARLLQQMLTGIDVYPDRLEIYGWLGAQSLSRTALTTYQVGADRASPSHLVRFVGVLSRFLPAQQQPQDCSQAREVLLSV